MFWLGEVVTPPLWNIIVKSYEGVVETSPKITWRSITLIGGLKPTKMWRHIVQLCIVTCLGSITFLEIKCIYF